VRKEEVGVRTWTRACVCPNALASLPATRSAGCSGTKRTSRAIQSSRSVLTLTILPCNFATDFL
jgi:hypothetical protein